MAVTRWVVVGSQHCRIIDKDVELKEQRIYPLNDFLWMEDMEHKVRACTCSSAVECNMVGVSCRWAYTNPEAARF